jgi:hypothetical protein
MKLEQIFAEWEKDSNIDQTELGEESLKISKLHHKYFQILTYERVQHRKLEAELKVLRLDKHEFYTQGPTKETMDKGWELPPVGKILRSDVTNYLEADKDIVNLSLKIGIQLEKIDLLKSIITTLNNRGYNIKAAIDWEKFKMGI